MKRKTVERWFQACLVGSAVAGGCNRQEVPVAKNDSDLLAPVSAWAQKDPRAITSSIKRADSAIVTTGWSMPNGTPLVVGKEAPPAAELPAGSPPWHSASPPPGCQ